MPVEIIDCEGKCCCRCNGCAGSGYYDKYSITIPAISASGASACDLALLISFKPNFTVTATGFETSTGSVTVPVLGSPPSITAPTYSSEAVYGSAGGTGACVWSYFDVDTSTAGTWKIVYVRFYSLGVGMGMEIRYDYYLYTPAGGCGLQRVTSIFTDATGSCITPGGTAYPNTSTTVVSTPGTWFPAWTGSAAANIGSGATWYQCGENSDGTTYVAVMESAAPAMMAAAAPSVPTRLTRCISLGVRTEFRAGCGGWMCGHACEKGLPAMPGGYCQTCESYEPDPDYESQGVAGWLS